MQIMITSLPTNDKSAVIPVERPTVEKADTASNAIGIRPFSPSLRLNMKIAKKIAEAAKRNIEKALCSNYVEIVLFPISILF